jgi:hypothetical protein
MSISRHILVAVVKWSWASCRWPVRVGRANSRIIRAIGLQYTGTVSQDPYVPDETAVQNALRGQLENPVDHDVTLIAECLRLTPEERLQRLTS